MTQQFQADVAVVGSGAGGSAVAGELAAAGLDVLVIEAGPKWFDPLGTHVRNVYSSEADLSRVGDIIYGEMLSYPSGADAPIGNLKDLKVAHGTGGMFALWMGNCPYPDTGELPPWMNAADWTPYFDRALALMHIDQAGGGEGKMFEALLEKTRKAIGPRPDGREVRPMPFAARRVDGKLKITASDELFFRGARSLPNLRVMSDCIVGEVIANRHKATGLRAVRRTDRNEPIEISADTIVISG
ncbi:GMC family oxidoreductase, partial [Mesorhizobium sp. M4A.F.Ca.ET.020.02.1.1]|uniref:NAD(P)-binding protein n=1 Tax=Mesorhizobium sp. M4A.F.Ca.ET.020.02.1.1 TaxID=2496652 RepID=UPI000FD1AE77